MSFLGGFKFYFMLNAKELNDIRLLYRPEDAGEHRWMRTDSTQPVS